YRLTTCQQFFFVKIWFVIINMYFWIIFFREHPVEVSNLKAFLGGSCPNCNTNLTWGCCMPTVNYYSIKGHAFCLVDCKGKCQLKGHLGSTANLCKSLWCKLPDFLFMKCNRSNIFIKINNSFFITFQYYALKAIDDSFVIARVGVNNYFCTDF
ncbi:unnamed protein product, partial [Owenia fusiformis]